MTLLIVVTVIYMPIMQPLLLPGVSVDVGQIAVSLFGLMIVPLAIGLVVRARWADAADEANKPLAQISNVSLVLLLVLMLGLNIENVISLFGSGALLATLIMTVVAAGAGYLLGGPSREMRSVLSMGTALPNMAATFIVAGGSFADQPNVLLFLAAPG
jgi:predicted Na+-dependent transporter